MLYSRFGDWGIKDLSGNQLTNLNWSISEDVNKGFKRIRVGMKVKSDADEETLTKLAIYSPVYETVSNAILVEFNLTRI